MKGTVFFLFLLIVIAVGGGGVLYALKSKGRLRPDVAALLPPLPPQAEAIVEMIPVPDKLGNLTTTGPAAGPAVATPSTTPAPAAPAAAPAKYDLTAQADGLSKAVATLTMANGLVIKIRFFTNDAPNTVKRIAQLISTGFYNGIAFHRVEPDFVVQVGDPTGTGAGGSGTKLKAEFNKRKHEPGIVSMARLGNDVNSADSQFFIMLRTWAPLDGQYTVIGKVVEGYEKIKAGIKKGDKIKSFTIQ
jgi:cyclophilin family peptidyl-prolyl cis-trans isomerase